MRPPLSRLARTFAAGFNCAAVAVIALLLYRPAPGPAPGSGTVHVSGPSIQRMVGQMLLVGFRGTSPDQAGPALVREQIAAGRISGVLFLSDNIKN